MPHKKMSNLLNESGAFIDIMNITPVGKKDQKENAKIQEGMSVNTKDDLLGGFSFEELITTVHSNEKFRDEKAIKKVFKELLKARVSDAESELKSNMKMILSELK